MNTKCYFDQCLKQWRTRTLAMPSSVICSSPKSARNKEDLPPPVSPTTAIRAPLGIFRLRFLRQGMSSPSREKEAFVRSTLLSAKITIKKKHSSSTETKILSTFTRKHWKCTFVSMGHFREQRLYKSLYLMRRYTDNKYYRNKY